MMNFKYLYIILLIASLFSQSQESIVEKNNLASAYIDAGLYDDAISIYENILDIQISILGENNIELVNTIYKLADSYILNNDLKLSEKYIKQAIKIQEFSLLINQKKYLPSFKKLKKIYTIQEDSLNIQKLDSIMTILLNIDKNDSLFFYNDSIGYKIPQITTLLKASIDSTNLVSEYSINDQALEFIDNALFYLDMGVYSEAVKQLDMALILNSKIVNLDYLLNLNISDSVSVNNLYNTLYDIEKYDTTNTTSKLFLGILGIKKQINDTTIINHIKDYINIYPNDIKSFLLLGNIAMQQNAYIDAVGYLHRALLINSNNIKANFNLGLSLMNLGKHEDAIVQFEKVIQLDANHVQARFNLGFLFFTIEQFEKSIFELTQSLLLDSNNSKTYYYLGQSYKAINKMKQALESFSMSIRISPEYGESHYELGLIYQSILKFEDAILEYKKAKIYISNDILNYNLGYLLYIDGEHHEALAPLREYIINYPTDYVILEILGDIFKKENRYSEAIDTYIRLIDSFPNNLEYHYGIAESYLYLGNYVQAKKYYLKILSFNEENSAVLFTLGEISSHMNDFYGAEIFFVESIHCGSKNKQVLFELGLAYGAQKKYLQALEVFQEALKYSLDDPILHYQLGVVFQEMGIFELAIKEYEYFLSKNQNDVIVIRMIGLCYYHLSNFNQSIDYLLKATSLFNNKDIMTLYHLGLSYLKIDNYKNAAKYLKLILKINPDHANSHYKLINIYQLLNRPREASKECDILYMLDRELYYSARFCNM